MHLLVWTRATTLAQCSGRPCGWLDPEPEHVQLVAIQFSTIPKKRYVARKTCKTATATYKSKSEDSVRKKGLLSSSSLRLLVIIIILSAASYIILDNLLPKMMKNWFPEAYETEIEEVI